MKTSIIILTYNKLDLTKKCLESIKKHTPADEIEIIVVDNGSTDGTREYLSNSPSVKTKFNDQNAGFAKGCNQGFHMSSGENILFLNNDTVVTPNWLSSMLHLLHQNEKTGMVGPISNYASGLQQIPVSYVQLHELDDFSNTITRTNQGLSKKTLRLVGFCLLAKRSVLDDIGLFDESYGIGSFEDDDLCFRALQKGYHLKVALDSYVHHEGHATFHGNAELDIHHSFHQNKQQFIDKWHFDTVHLYPRHEIIERVPPTAQKVLDIGCAAGATGIELMNRQNCKVYGVEIDPGYAHIAKHQYTHIDIGDIEKIQLDYPEAFFDTLILSNVLEQLVDPWNVLQKLSTYLQPGGTLICCVPNASHSELFFALLQGHWSYTNSGILNRDHLRFFTASTLIESLSHHSFKVENIDPFHVNQTTQHQMFFIELAHLAAKFGIPTCDLEHYTGIDQFLVRAIKT